MRDLFNIPFYLLAPDAGGEGRSGGEGEGAETPPDDKSETKPDEKPAPKPEDDAKPEGKPDDPAKALNDRLERLERELAESNGKLKEYDAARARTEAIRNAVAKAKGEGIEVDASAAERLALQMKGEDAAAIAQTVVDALGRPAPKRDASPAKPPAKSGDGGKPEWETVNWTELYRSDPDRANALHREMINAKGFG